MNLEVTFNNSKVASPVYQYQYRVAGMLKEIYTLTPVEIEWASMTDEYNLYCPRVDIAVGPFATSIIIKKATTKKAMDSDT